MNRTDALEIVLGLEAFKNNRLDNNHRLVIALVDLVTKGYYDLPGLNKLAEAALSMDSGFSVGEYPIEFSPQSILEAEILEKNIASWVSDIRKEIFKTDKVPFENRDKALVWLLQEFKKDIEQASKINEGIVHVITYDGLMFFAQNPVGLIWLKTLIISRKTGINHNSLVMHVLANTNIICNKWELKRNSSIEELPSGMKIGVNSLEIQYRGETNFEDFRKVYFLVNKDSKPHSKIKQINAVHLALYRLVKGGDPTW